MIGVTSKDHARAEDDTLPLVVSIWEAVLGRAVRPEDDFFRLGGTSLQATVAMVRINQRVGRVLTLANLLSNPKARDLAACIDRLVAEPRPVVAVPSRVGGRSWVTSDQARRLAVRATDGYLPHERITLAYRVCGPFDATRLVSALDALVVRQDALRTSFGLDSAGQPVATVRESGAAF